MSIKTDTQIGRDSAPQLQQCLVSLAAYVATDTTDWEGALAWLYRLTRARVVSAARRGWFVEDPEDLVQDLIIELIPRVHSYRPGARSVGGFLTLLADLKITSRCKRMLIQRRRMQSNVCLDSLSQHSCEPAVEARLDLDALLGMLSADEREIAQLLLDDYKPQALASRWGVSGAAARQRCCRTRMAMRKSLS